MGCRPVRLPGAQCAPAEPAGDHTESDRAALARGEAEPVRRALSSQPQPPAGCAYAIWLRNHDELDLEQLSPAERDEAMAVFAPHPQMRAFGRGIRRRLAPMLVDPRQRRLAIFLLCALPGTPILLYGDEIGMGDEIEMPDRAAVRTPMQWTEELNAGFSTCNPTELIHPVITTGALRHQDVNVRQQLREPDSLLSTVHELFTARRSFGPFLASGCRTLELDQPSVLGLRHERVGCESLLLANLSPERTDAGLPEPLSGEWRQVAVDQQYDDDPAADRSQQAHLHGYGYRWWARER